MTVKPIRPEDVVSAKEFPNEVIEAFNALIAKNYSYGSAHFLQKEVVDILVERGFSHYKIFSDHLLDIEELYEQCGWWVVYNENYEAFLNLKKNDFYLAL